MVEAKWTTRLSRWTMRLGVLALVVALGGVLLARYDLVPKMAGFSALLGGAVLAVVGTIAGLIAVILNARHKGGLMRSALIGLLLSAGFVGFMVSRVASAGTVPAIHDVTTNVQDPPAFTKIKLADDNLRGIGTVERWRDVHTGAYAQLRPITLNRPVAAVIADAERLARARGWEIVLADPAAGQLEATASVSLIAFKDDVALRVRPAADGTGTVIDMRSVSRVGIGDLGVNAKRITEFLTALAKG